MRINHIESRSVVDGPGVRTVLFTQGCNIGCPGCQNRHIWPADGGYTFDTEDLAKTLVTMGQHPTNITISGGEPFLQPQALLDMVYRLRSYDVSNIIIYTGYRLERLLSGMGISYFDIMSILGYIDILVDGPFVKSQDHDKINWRGSANQRVIDTQKSLELYSKNVLEKNNFKFEPVLIDWDSPVITIKTNGDAFMPVGLAAELHDLGTVENTRMCGQTK